MFRFTIRDVLWLIALSGFAIAWWVDHRRLTQAFQNYKAPRTWMLPEAGDNGDPRISINPGERLIVEMNEHREVNTSPASYFGLSNIVSKDGSTREVPHYPIPGPLNRP
jgi:hypothetical protein